MTLRQIKPVVKIETLEIFPRWPSLCGYIVKEVYIGRLSSLDSVSAPHNQDSPQNCWFPITLCKVQMLRLTGGNRTIDKLTNPKCDQLANRLPVFSIGAVAFLPGGLTDTAVCWLSGNLGGRLDFQSSSGMNHVWSPTVQCTRTVRYCLQYSALICTALYYTYMYCTAMYCTVLYYTALYCTDIYCTFMYCTAMYCTVLYYIGLYCTALYCIAMYSTVLYFTALYCTDIYCTVL